MNILIIGHNSGIGKAISDKLVWSVGISKSTGFDINMRYKEFDYNKFDCIILNAYDLFTSQLNTMMEIAKNFDKQKLLIVLASTSAYKTNPSDLYWAGYAVEKAAIVKLGRDMNTMGFNVAMVSPGTVDTARNYSKTITKLSTETIAKIVNNIIEEYKKGILIEHTVIRTVKE